MIATDRPIKPHARLSRALHLRIKHPAPPAVVTWVQDHLRMPESDLRRMKKLYDKVMQETITPGESAELDSLMDACAAMDLLRARMLTGGASVRQTRQP